MHRQQHVPPNLPASNPFANPDYGSSNSQHGHNSSDRWRQQPLPTPPPLHVNLNSHFMNSNGHGAVQVMPRERGPRTPRDSELLQPQHSGKGNDDHRSSASPSVDPTRPFSSLFSRAGVEPNREVPPSQGHAPLNDQYTQYLNQNQQQARSEYAGGQEVSFRHFEHNHQQNYDANQRAPPPQSTPPGASSNRPKMLFDPQSNAFRELAGSEKNPPKKQDSIRRSGPPQQDHAEQTAAVTRKTMQINRIEQNPGEKWNRQVLPKDSSFIRQEVSAVSRTAATAFDDVDDDKSLRQDQQDARKEARNKERAERGPRTKGFLFHYTADGQIERIYTPEEKIRADALKARKAEKAEKDRRLAGIQENPLAVSSIDNLPLRLSHEQYNALTIEQKQELKAKQQEMRAARDSSQSAKDSSRVDGVSSTAGADAAASVANLPLKLSKEEYNALTKEQQQELKLRQQKVREERKAVKSEGKRADRSKSVAGSTTSSTKAVDTAPTSDEYPLNRIGDVRVRDTVAQTTDRSKQEQILSGLDNDVSSNWPEMASASQWDRPILSEFPIRRVMPSVQPVSRYAEQPGNW